jgi:outer membrane protein OmpA-like peptidoglycan-associated protein
LQRFSWNDVLNVFDPDPNHVCGRELEDAQDWAAGGPYPTDPQTLVGAGGLGGFDAQYRPDAAQGNGVLQISQGVAVTFKNTLVAGGAGVVPHPDLPVTPDMTALAARVNAIPDATRKATAVAAYQWSPAEKAPWIAQLEPQIEQGWGGQHEFFLNKPRWEWLGASVAVDLNIGERAKGAADHMDLETYKTPSGESLRTFDIPHQVSHGSGTDARDQRMRLASTSVGPKEIDLLRESVQFALGSFDLTPAAQTTLDGFIATFNGANAHVAHQEIHVDVIGHTSAQGTEADNQLLSERRATTVQEYLRSHGFVNVATRVLAAGRGEREADQTTPRRASDQRVDLVVDGGARMITAMHEFGHAFGLDDEYGTVGTAPSHDAWARDMTDASGAHLPGAVREHNAGAMSFGTEVRPRHYATFHHALQTVTAQSPWSLGPHKAKWQVQMECGEPSPPGDWNVPKPGTGDRTA